MVDGYIVDFAVTVIAGGNIDENFTQDEINLHEEIARFMADFMIGMVLLKS